MQLDIYLTLNMIYTLILKLFHEISTNEYINQNKKKINKQLIGTLMIWQWITLLFRIIHTKASTWSRSLYWLYWAHHCCLSEIRWMHGAESIIIDSHPKCYKTWDMVCHIVFTKRYVIYYTVFARNHSSFFLCLISAFLIS